MGSSKKLSVWVIGMALFSMFFGSGNLIFPLSIGQMAQDDYLWGMTGFLITGVLLPFFGVISMVVYKGDYTEFFGTIGKTAGFLFTLALLTVWIPLGSAPRCITLAYVNAKPYLGSLPLWTFSLIYSLLLFPMSYRKMRAMDILGYVLTPLLLLCLAAIVVQGWRYSSGSASSGLGVWELSATGLSEGYNTMDLIASFFFTSTVITALREATGSPDTTPKSLMKVAVKACAVGVILLAVVYIGLITVSAANASLLVGVPKDELLARLVLILLGPELRIVATAAVVLACVTTSIALLIVYADFLTNNVFKGRVNIATSMLLTLGMSFGMSIFGFQGISKVTGPILGVFYPCLILLIIWAVGVKKYLLPAKVQKVA